MRATPALTALSFALTLAGVGLATGGDAHEGPEPGQCYGRTERPPVYDSERQRVPLTRGRWEEHGRAPEYRDLVRRVLVRPATVERLRTPALYRTVEHWMVEPGQSRWVRTAPEYRMERREVLIQPAHAEWRRQPPHFDYEHAAPGQTRVEPTGEVLCRVWCPAKYGWSERRVQVSRGGWTRVGTPPHRYRVTQRVLVRREGLVIRRIPAAYRTERVSQLVRPGYHRRVWIAPSYGTVIVHHPHPGGPAWSRVVCAGPLSPAFRSQLQGALNARGYDAGPADGAERRETYDALRRFQRDHRMPEGQVTVESARALGVQP